jgi:hypothetical protein
MCIHTHIYLLKTSLLPGIVRTFLQDILYRLVTDIILGLRPVVAPIGRGL